MTSFVFKLREVIKNIFFSLGLTEYSRWKKLLVGIDGLPFISNVKYFDKDIYFGKNDARSFFIKKGTQISKVNKIINICKKNKVTLYLDCGANYGEFTIPMIDYASRVVAIEPNPLVNTCLKLSCASFSNVEVVTAAIHKIDSEFVMLTIDPEYSGGSSLLDHMPKINFRHPIGVAPNYFNVLVPTISIRTLLNKYTDHLANILIKIDIEGYEPELLEDICSNLEILREYTIIFEYHSVTTGDDGIKKINKIIENFIKKNNINIYIMYNNEKSLVKIENLTDLYQFINNEIIISTLELN
jgi:FkbM family methyltransferase